MNKNLLLGTTLFILEFSVFFILGYFLTLNIQDILMLAGIYFVLLFAFDHFSFAPRLVWQEIVDMVKIHILYLIIAIIFCLRISIKYILVVLLITMIMFIIDIFFERMMRKYLKRYANRVLMFGAGDEAKQMNDLVNSNHFLFINVIGYVDLEYYTKKRPCEDPLVKEMLIPLHIINEVIRKNHVDSIYILEDNLNSSQLEMLTSGLIEHVPVIKYHPATTMLQPYNTNIEDFDGTLFVSITDAKYRLFDRFVKKVIDILFGILGCVLLIPTTIFVKILFICTGDFDSIFFTQDRYGLNGEIIKIYKYRSMIKDAEKILKEAMEKDPKIKEEYETNKKLDPDPRVTKAGMFIRKTSIDEIPQFINVMKGDMSLIGPRPYLPDEKKDMGNSFHTIMKSKPGITGIWQANGRNNVSFKDRLKLDVYYYENWSISLDIIIIVKTIKAVLFRDGAK